MDIRIPNYKEDKQYQSKTKTSSTTNLKDQGISPHRLNSPDYSYSPNQLQIRIKKSGRLAHQNAESKYATQQHIGQAKLTYRQISQEIKQKEASIHQLLYKGRHNYGTNKQKDGKLLTQFEKSVLRRKLERTEIISSKLLNQVLNEQEGEAINTQEFMHKRKRQKSYQIYNPYHVHSYMNQELNEFDQQSQRRHIIPNMTNPKYMFMLRKLQTSKHNQSNRQAKLENAQEDILNLTGQKAYLNDKYQYVTSLRNLFESRINEGLDINKFKQNQDINESNRLQNFQKDNRKTIYTSYNTKRETPGSKPLLQQSKEFITSDTRIKVDMLQQVNKLYQRKAKGGRNIQTFSTKRQSLKQPPCQELISFDNLIIRRGYQITKDSSMHNTSQQSLHQATIRPTLENQLQYSASRQLNPKLGDSAFNATFDSQYTFQSDRENRRVNDLANKIIRQVDEDFKNKREIRTLCLKYGITSVKQQKQGAKKSIAKNSQL